jgi:hypothetical protein
MENLEQRCLEKLNNILSKFNLKIEIIYAGSSRNVWYRLIDNSLSKNTYSDWLGLWASISNVLMHSSNSIFECLSSYSYQRYSKAYNAIKHLENICCLEEFLIKCDLLEI